MAINFKNLKDGSRIYFNYLKGTTDQAAIAQAIDEIEQDLYAHGLDYWLGYENGVPFVEVWKIHEQKYIVIEQQEKNGYFKYHLLSEEQYRKDISNWADYRFIPKYFNNFHEAEKYIEEKEKNYVVYLDKEKKEYGLCPYDLAENLYQNNIYYTVLFIGPYSSCIEYLDYLEKEV